MSRALVLLGLAGCMGPRDETLLYELRLVALAAQPALPAVGEPFVVEVTTADPLGEGGELMLWSCGPEACSREIRPLEEQVLVEGVLEGPEPLTLWAIACAPGRCGDLAAVPDATLRAPEAWLQGLPLTGVSAGARTVRSEAVDLKQVENPELTEQPPGVVPADAERGTELRFRAFGAQRAYGYTTSGGFDATAYPVESLGDVTLRWFADPEAPEREARLYVVLEDGFGGVTVWRGTGGPADPGAP